MTLPVEMIARPVAVLPPEKVVEPQFPCVRGGGVGGNVPPNAVEMLVGSCDHHHGVPPNDAVQALFQRQIAGIGALIVRMNGVEVSGVHSVDFDSRIVGCLHGGEQQASGLFWAVGLLDRTNGIPPFLRGHRVWVWCRGT